MGRVAGPCQALDQPAIGQPRHQDPAAVDGGGQRVRCGFPGVGLSERRRRRRRSAAETDQSLAAGRDHQDAPGSIGGRQALGHYAGAAGGIRGRAGTRLDHRFHDGVGVAVAASQPKQRWPAGVRHLEAGRNDLALGIGGGAAFAGGDVEHDRKILGFVAPLPQPHETHAVTLHDHTAADAVLELAAQHPLLACRRVHGKDPDAVVDEVSASAIGHSARHGDAGGDGPRRLQTLVADALPRARARAIPPPQAAVLEIQACHGAVVTADEDGVARHGGHPPHRAVEAKPPCLAAIGAAIGPHRPVGGAAHQEQVAGVHHLGAAIHGKASLVVGPHGLAIGQLPSPCHVPGVSRRKRRAVQAQEQNNRGKAECSHAWEAPFARMGRLDVTRPMVIAEKKCSPVNRISTIIGLPWLGIALVHAAVRHRSG